MGLHLGLEFVLPRGHLAALLFRAFAIRNLEVRVKIVFQYFLVACRDEATGVYGVQRKVIKDRLVAHSQHTYHFVSFNMCVDTSR
jgi:hypothetical protein